MSEIEPVEDDFASSAVNSLDYVEPTERPLVSRYLQTWEERQDLLAIRDAQGRFIYDDKGNPSPHPVIKMIADADKMLLAIEKEMGLTPAARLRLTGDALNIEEKKQSLGSLLDEVEEL